MDQLRFLDENIMIAHFSGRHGPHDFLFDTDVPEVCKFENYIDHVLLPKYKVNDTNSEQRLRGLCVAWKTAWAEMWRELIARVHTQKPHKAENFMECPACGQFEEDRGLTFEHTFYECKETEHFRNEFTMYVQGHQPQLLRLGWRASMCSEKVFPGALTYVDQVLRRRVPDIKAIFGVGRVGETPLRCAQAFSEAIRPVIIVNTASGITTRGGTAPRGLGGTLVLCRDYDNGRCDRGRDYKFSHDGRG